MGSGVSVGFGVGCSVGVGVGTGVGCWVGARVATVAGADVAEGAVAPLLQAANNMRPDRVRQTTATRRRIDKLGSFYFVITETSTGWTGLEAKRVYLSGRRNC